MITTTRKLGANRGATRLWIEGKFLTDCGFVRGMTWNLGSFENTLLICFAPDGKRKVAGTDARPIIDINSTALLACLGTTGDTVTLTRTAMGVIQVNKGA